MRFDFGKNWGNFINKSYSQQRSLIARKCLLDALLTPDLQGKTFLDIGCGCGIHSYAALQAGAKFVIGFDLDINSIKAAYKLWWDSGRPRNWKVIQGDVLDDDSMKRFRDIDIVYAWGSLHHTGEMRRAICNAVLPLLNSGAGDVFLMALYSYNTYKSFLKIHPEEWLALKKAYNSSNAFKKGLMEFNYILKSYFSPEMRWLQLHSFLKKYLSIKRDYKINRGMDLLTDIRDWLGGWPMEFAREDECVELCEKQLGLRLARLRTGKGNSEFLFATQHGSTWLEPLFKSRKTLDVTAPFEANDPLVWRVFLPQFKEHCDTRDQPRRSSLRLWEDDVPLSSPHSPYEDIFNFGNGRYRHWGEHIYFTTRDNSDPNINGRKYRITIDDEDVITQMLNKRFA